MKTYRTHLKQKKDLLYSTDWSDKQVSYLQILSSFPSLPSPMVLSYPQLCSRPPATVSLPHYPHLQWI